MYSIEYKWTSEDTPQTTSNIVTLSESKQKAQGTTNNSMFIQGETIIEQAEPERADSRKARRENVNAMIIDKVDKTLEPWTPIKRPNKFVEIKLKKGKSKISKYIGNKIGKI